MANKYSFMDKKEIYAFNLANCPHPCTNDYAICLDVTWECCKKHLETQEEKLAQKHDDFMI